MRIEPNQSWANLKDVRGFGEGMQGLKAANKFFVDSHEHEGRVKKNREMRFVEKNILPNLLSGLTENSSIKARSLDISVYAKVGNNYYQLEEVVTVKSWWRFWSWGKGAERLYRYKTNKN